MTTSTPEGERATSLVEFCARLPEPGTDRGRGQQQRCDVAGVLGSGAALLAHSLAERASVASGESGSMVLLVTANAALAEQAALDLGYFAGRRGAEADVMVLLPSEHSPYDAIRGDRLATLARLHALTRLLERPPRFVVTSAIGLCRRFVPGAALRRHLRTLRVGDTVDLSSLATTLVESGYQRQPLVEDPGTLAVRGGLLDVWAVGDSHPTRLELEGDSIARMTTFDPDTQLGRQGRQELCLPPASELLCSTPEEQTALATRLRALCDGHNYPSTKTRRLVTEVLEGRALFEGISYLPAAYELVPLWEYLPSDAAVVIEDAAGCVKEVTAELERAAARLLTPHDAPRFERSAFFVDPTEVREALGGHFHVLTHQSHVQGSATVGDLSDWQYAPAHTPSLALHDQRELLRALAQSPGDGKKTRSLAPLARQVAEWQQQGLRVTFTARTHTQAERLRELLAARSLEFTGGLGGVEVGSLSRGLVAPLEGQVWVTEHEIFGKRADGPQTKLPSKRTAGGVDDLRALKAGDTVVHVEHGVGRYLGLENRALGSGSSIDLLVIEYRGGDRLYVPVYRMNLIQKVGAGDAATSLDRLGGSTFAKTKAKVRRKARDIADQLLSLYAERANSERPCFGAPEPTYLEFEAAFPYEETGDQAAAIEDIMSDLRAPRVMDRLLCGDVGFGKTEVALRAAFRHILAGNQVAFLCPTTILAHQHFQTAQKRFEGHAVRVEHLSRFRTKNEQTEVVLALREGRCDLVLGTHRLLSKDVHFKRLGLLIVDEEQRFGVAAKERIKQLKKDIDVLTLSATPIPRTLQLAVGGLQDLSVIRTPPPGRRSVRTITAGYDESLIAEAIEQELARGGQVYYVHNRIEGLYEKANRLKELVPKARVAVGHGQLSPDALERTMLSFVQGQADVLVATAIVESGLDIPRANTLIIDRADLFGLAQLYQLRGRVGRSSERAHCYLLVPPPSQLSDEARVRIEALSRYTELGSGLKLAELDLELRGAGDFLGAEQSGAVQSVGFELFCEMLREATAELRGETVQHEVDPEISIDLEALLPTDYIAEVGVRLSLYKRLASAESEAAVDTLAVEVENRFGPLPRAAQNLVELMRLKASLRLLRALSCEASPRAVTLHLRHDTPVNGPRLLRLAAERSSTYRVTPEGRIVRRPNAREVGLSGLHLATRLATELEELVDAPSPDRDRPGRSGVAKSKALA